MPEWVSLSLLNKITRSVTTRKVQLITPIKALILMIVLLDSIFPLLIFKKSMGELINKMPNHKSKCVKRMTRGVNG